MPTNNDNDNNVCILWKFNTQCVLLKVAQQHAGVPRAPSAPSARAESLRLLCVWGSW